MDQTKALRVAWFYDRTDPEHLRYELRCTGELQRDENGKIIPDSEQPDPAYENLVVSVSAEECNERLARARLILMMYDRAKELGIDESRLRFIV